MESGEAICCFGEAIAFYDYSVSSGPFFFRFEIVIGPGPGPGPELDNYESLSIYRETLPNQLYHLICFINQNFCLFWLYGENPIIFGKCEKV